MNLLRKIQEKLKESPRARSILLYLCFVIIAAIFWGFLTFNNDVRLDVEVPVKIIVPDNIHLLSKAPDSLTVTVSDRGYKFIAYFFKKTPTLTLRFNDYIDGTTNTFRMSQEHLKKALAAAFNKRANIISVLPESIIIRYTDLPGKKVPIVTDIVVEPREDYVHNGALVLSQDSALVFGDAEVLNAINEVYTHHVEARNLTDTLRRRVAIANIPGGITEPNTIEVMVPVEKLKTVTRTVKIDVRNAPSGVKVLLFPSDVEVTYRSPLSRIKDDGDITVVLDYNDVNVAAPGNKVPVQIVEIPFVYKDPELSQDSVEYIIEKSK